MFFSLNIGRACVYFSPVTAVISFCIEEGRIPNKAYTDRIQPLLDFIASDGHSIDEIRGFDDLVPQPEEHVIPEPVSFTFKTGSRYAIYLSEKDLLRGLEYECTFVFVAKRGRHHVFRAERGGWLTTYTDAQLIGKKIKQVKQ